MGDDRGWMIRKATGGTEIPFDSKLGSIIGPDTEAVAVFPASRLAEVEAENKRLRGLLDNVSDNGHPQYARGYYLAEMRCATQVEQAEAQLRQMREALEDLLERQHDYPTSLSRSPDWQGAFTRARALLSTQPEGETR